jgi:hypothetical protein
MSELLSPETVNDALAIMKALLLKGQIARNDALYAKYTGPGQRDVRMLLHQYFLPLWDAVIVDARDALYFYVSPGNTEIGYKADALRERLSSRTPSAGELNLYLFVMMAVACLSQGDAEAVHGARIYFKDEEIVRFIDEKLRALLTVTNLAVIETEHALDIRGVAERWFEMQTADDRDPARTQKHRLGLVHKVLRFWHDEDLIHLESDGRVFPRPRLQVALSSYYSDRQRKDVLMQLLMQAVYATEAEVATAVQEE